MTLHEFEKFLTGREFFRSDGGFLSGKYRERRGVPQGAVLSPPLFNVLMSSIRTIPTVHTFVYANDIAFFASATSVDSLHVLLQGY